MTRIYLFVLVLLLSACAPLHTYRQQPDVKAWEPDIAKFELVDQTKSYPDDAVLFAGSSSIKLWETINKDMLPYNVIQRGYGGAKLSDFAVYADRIIYPHPCQAIVLFVGNDITGSKDDKTPQQVANLFRRTLYIIRRKYIDIPVFWISITPTEARWQVWPEIKKANGLIKNICYNHRNTYYINTEQSFLGANGLPRAELFQKDKLHLNQEGYKIWAGIIKKELNKALKDK
jgi:lysophospholipase L1-like esterase